MHRIRGFFVVALLCSAVLWSTSIALAQTSAPTPSTWGKIKAMYGVSDKSGDPQLAIGSKRYWVRNECWYALNRDWLNRGDDPNGPGGNGTMSNWNWLSTAADAGSNGLKYALNTYQVCVSDLIPNPNGCPYGSCGTGCEIWRLPSPKNTIDYWVGQLSSDSYGWAYENNYHGHGTQCVSFVAMVIYRATGGSYRLSWSWSNSPKSTDPSAINAQPGDIVYKTSGTKHLAICVKNYGSGITLVDSNFLSHEVIGRHDLSSSAIGSTWKMQSGSGRWY